MENLIITVLSDKRGLTRYVVNGQEIKSEKVDWAKVKELVYKQDTNRDFELEEFNKKN